MTEPNESRLDRIEKILVGNAEQIAQLTRDMDFLRAVVQGYISQSTLPVHQE